MKMHMGLSFALVVAAIPALSFAGDLSKIQKCVQQGYNRLSDRHAVVAAVLDATDSNEMIFGAAKLDQIFEIGSITKTFSDPIPTKYQKPGPTITFENLTTHTSGITDEIFPGFKISNPLAPFEGLTVDVFKDLYFKTPLVSKPNEAWKYSNIGVSLLGLILSENSGISYESMVGDQILKIIGMNDSYFEVPVNELGRFPQGYMKDPDGNVVSIPHWDLYNTAIDPAGGLRSTITDMVKYARANLVPPKSPLGDAISLTQKQLYFIKQNGKWIGMNWIIEPSKGLIWHNGQTYGFNSILAISTTSRQAVVAMTDTTVLKTDQNGKADFDSSLQNVAFDCLK